MLHNQYMCFLFIYNDNTGAIYEEPYDWTVSRLPQAESDIEPVMEQCPAYGVLTT